MHVGIRSLMLSGCGLYDFFRDRFDGLPFSSPEPRKAFGRGIIDSSLERGVLPSKHLDLTMESSKPPASSAMKSQAARSARVSDFT